MKKYYPLLAVLALLISCGGYSVSGTAPEGSETVIVTIADTVNICSDTIALGQDRTFRVSGKVDHPVNCNVTIQKGDKRPIRVSAFMMNDKVELVEDTASWTGYSLACASGLAKEYNDIEGLLMKADDVFAAFDSVLEANPASPTLPKFISELYYSMTPDDFDRCVSKISPENRSSMYLVKPAKRMDLVRNTVVGKPFIDFAAETPDGVMTSISSLRSEGRWLLIDFWASWCGPCRGENPNVVKAYSEFHDKGLDICGVSLDNDKQAWIDAIAKDGLTWTHISDLKGWKCEASNLYGVFAIPANVLVDPDGIIAARNLREEKLTEFLSEKLQ